jgi:hypothetical protein
MSMAWMILLAMVAEAGGHHVHPPSDHARPAGDPTIRAQGPGPSRSLSVARKACPGHWSFPVLEEFDTEEVDEAWMVHLDAVATVPGRQFGPAWSPSSSRPMASEESSLPPQSYFPLRC